MPAVLPGEVRSYAVEFRSQKNRTMRGLAAPYGGVHDLGPFTETLQAGCFSKSIREAAASLPLLMHHDHGSIPVGRAVSWEEDDSGLVGEWQFDSRAEAVEAARLADEGYLTGLSVGFQPLRCERDDNGDKPHLVQREAKLLETSLVTIPAYDSARVLMVRSAALVVPEPVAVPRSTPMLDEWRSRLAALRGV
jgi:HK97 family phage prohead protease